MKTVIIIIIVLAVINELFKEWKKYLSKPKCPGCGKRNATILSRREGRSETIFFRSTEKIQEYKNKWNFRTKTGMNAATDSWYNPPDKISTREVTLPGKRVWYKVLCQCNKCGKKFYVSECKDIEPTIINK